MNLDAANISSDLDRPLGDLVKGLRKEKNAEKRKERKERRKNNSNGQNRQGGNNQRRGLTYARRAPAGQRGQRRDHGRQRQYVEVAPQRYRYASRYVEYPRYAPVFVTRSRGPRRYAYEEVPHGAPRYIEEEPIRVRYEEIPREDIRVQGTARMPRVVDRVDANRARRRQAVERRRQENHGNKQQNAKN